MTIFNIIVLSLFFLVIEWRWQLELLGINVPNPYYPVAMLCGVVSIISVTGFIMFNRETTIFSIIAFFLMLYCLCILIFNIPELILLDKKEVIVELGVWAINFGLFFIAMDGSVWRFIEEHTRSMIIIYILFVMSPIILMFFLGSGAETNYSLRSLINLLDIAGDDNYGVSYQSYGDKIALLSFLMFFISKNKIVKMLVVFITAVSLYVVGSKASMLGFASAIFVWYVINTFDHKNIFKFIVITAALIGAFLFIQTNIIGNPDLQESKYWIVKSLASGSEDESVESRKEIQTNNQKTLKTRLLLGNYKFDLKEGRPGSYTHNILFFLDYYGIFYFSVFVMFWLYLLILNIKSKHNLLITNYATLSMIYFTILMLVARSGSGYLTYWTLGCAVASKKSRRGQTYTIDIFTYFTQLTKSEGSDLHN
jgi:hypothetical protein